MVPGLGNWFSGLGQEIKLSQEGEGGGGGLEGFNLATS